MKTILEQSKVESRVKVNQCLEKLKKKEEVKKNVTSIVYKIVKHVPKTYQEKAKALLARLIKNGGISWDHNYTLYVNKQRMGGTNIIELVNDILCKTVKDDPIGWQYFARIVSKVNFPLKYVGNNKRHDHIKNLRAMEFNMLSVRLKLENPAK